MLKPTKITLPKQQKKEILKNKMLFKSFNNCRKNKKIYKN